MQITPWKRQQNAERGLTLRDAMNQLFDESFWDPMGFLSDRSPAQRQWQFLPSFDVAETDKELHVVVDVPGYDPQNVSVRIDKGILCIEGSMEEDAEEKNKRWHRRETARGSFMRQLSLPQGIRDDQVKCKMKHGKLTIIIQKPKEMESSGKALQIDSE